MMIADVQKLWLLSLYITTLTQSEASHRDAVTMTNFVSPPATSSHAAIALATPVALTPPTNMSYLPWVADSTAPLPVNETAIAYKRVSRKLPFAPPSVSPVFVPTALPTVVTANPTTAEPTTAVPTTAKPTTLKPTTVLPTAIPSVLPTVIPSKAPTKTPSELPTEEPSEIPSEIPTIIPSIIPSEEPTEVPSEIPSEIPSEVPTVVPSEIPSKLPTDEPSEIPSEAPTIVPSIIPSEEPTEIPSVIPSEVPTEVPSEIPTEIPSEIPSKEPTELPSKIPSEEPTEVPSEIPSEEPTEVPSEIPSEEPTEIPSEIPSEVPTEVPSIIPSKEPTEEPSEIPSKIPTIVPTEVPSEIPTIVPTEIPSEIPSEEPTVVPSIIPSKEPTELPSEIPSEAPTIVPSIIPSEVPTELPSKIPSEVPTELPSKIPSEEPTELPSIIPSEEPTELPSVIPSKVPTELPSEIPSKVPTEVPSKIPSEVPTELPSEIPTIQPSVADPTSQPSLQPGVAPTSEPTWQSVASPTSQPSAQPFRQPSYQPIDNPSSQPSGQPSWQPVTMPTYQPISSQPTSLPTSHPTSSYWMPFGNYTAIVKQTDFFDFAVIDRATYILGGALFSVLDSTGKISRQHHFSSTVTEITAVTALNQSVMLSGVNHDRQAFIARLNVDDDEFSWQDLAFPNVQLTAMAYVPVSNSLIVAGALANENPMVLRINPDTGALISGNSYAVTGLTDIHINSVSGAVGFPGAVLAGYATNVNPRRQVLFLMATDENGVAIAVNTMTGGGSGAMRFINAIAAEPCSPAAQYCRQNSYIVGGTAASANDYGYAFIGMAVSPYLHSTAWNYCSRVPSQLNDVITLINSAGTYDVFASGSQALEQFLLVKMVDSKLMNQIRIQPPEGLALRNCTLEAIDQRIRTICAVTGARNAVEVNEAIVFNLDQTTLRTGKLPPGYAWYQDSSFSDCRFITTSKTASIIATSLFADGEVLATVADSVSPSSLPSAMLFTNPTNVPSGVSTQPPMIVNNSSSNTTVAPSAAPLVVVVKYSLQPSRQVTHQPSLQPTVRETEGSVLTRAPSSVVVVTLLPTPVPSVARPMKSLEPTVTGTSEVQQVAPTSSPSVTANPAKADHTLRDALIISLLSGAALLVIAKLCYDFWCNSYKDHLARLALAARLAELQRYYTLEISVQTVIRVNESKEDSTPSVIATKNKHKKDVKIRPEKTRVENVNTSSEIDLESQTSSGFDRFSVKSISSHTTSGESKSQHTPCQEINNLTAHYPQASYSPMLKQWQATKSLHLSGFFKTSNGNNTAAFNYPHPPLTQEDHAETKHSHSSQSSHSLRSSQYDYSSTASIVNPLKEQRDIENQLSLDYSLSSLSSLSLTSSQKDDALCQKIMRLHLRSGDDLSSDEENAKISHYRG